jgi:hypothetical protein
MQAIKPNLKANMMPLAIFLAACIPMPSAAKGIQFQCSGLEGHGYYAEEGLVSKGAGGWVQDKISEGESVITLDASNPDDIKITYNYKDSTGVWKNPESDGGSIISMGMDSEDLSFMFLVMYPQTSVVELITIAEISKSGGRMIYSTMKNASSVMTAKVMTAACRFPKAQF